ncbi:DUF4177 domain-containing protein [Fimbriiglobus ruber]|uniref:DUF4177 domain-containing protein n=1 Tax=Fimbriiglobus ruber TaxID=1908690 RepID=A0A225DQU0_9BACT|nr:DUF4177 domain-containing protein [Fimbriiglobus ruber]OWK43463.1 hypothetical protein FRUB_03062 [Fimbriiglobus ruber]
MKWEYVTVEFVATGFERPEVNEDYRGTMNRFGAEGWELVSAVTYHSPTAEGDAVILFFKRPA